MTTRNDSDSDASWSEPYASFDGGLEDLAEALKALMERFEWEDREVKIDRLIRYYRTEQAIDAPERRGKEAFYNFRHLAQYVAVRWLLKDGWPLAKAAAETISRPTEELIALASSPHDDSVKGQASAADLVAAFQSLASSPAKADSKPIADEIASRQLALSTRLGSLARDLSMRGAEGQPVAPREVLRLDLADWCSVTVDRDKADALTEDQARAVADALYRALLDVRVSRARAKKRS